MSRARVVTVVVPILLGLCSAAAIAVLVAVVFLRLPFPYELEWIEGGFADLTLRVSRGERLYVPPSLEQVGFIYPPLHFYLAAALTPLTGPGFLAPRLVSIGATLSTLGLLYRFAARDAGSRLAGLVAAGIYAASYDACGAWYDIARVDSLAILWMVAALHVMRFGETPAAMALAAAFLGVAYLSKQTMLGFLPALGILALLRGLRHGALFAGGAAVSLGAVPWLLDRHWDGWYTYWTIRAVAGQPRMTYLLERFVRNELLPRFPLLLLLAAACLVALIRLRDLRRAAFHGLTLGSALLLVALSASKTGGFRNLMMPACAVLSLMAALAIGMALDLARTSGAPRNATRLAAAAALLLVQLGLVAYDPRALVPTDADRAAGDRFVALLRSIDGPVLLPFHGYIPTLAGKLSTAHLSGLEDCVKGDREKLGKELRAEVAAKLAERRYAAIFLDHRWFAEEMPSHYVKQRDLAPEESLPLPRTGRQVRPVALWVPRESEPPPPDVRRRTARPVSAAPREGAGSAGTP